MPVASPFSSKLLSNGNMRLKSKKEEPGASRGFRTMIQYGGFETQRKMNRLRRAWTKLFLG